MTTTTEMTNAEKIEVLTKARDIISDPTKWSKGAYVDPFAGDDTQQAYCVMGAVAKAAGFLEDDPEGLDAPEKLAECSLATAVFNALPDSEKSWVFDQYSEYVYEDFGEYPDEYGYDDDMVLPEGMKENADTVDEAIAYLLEHHPDSTLDQFLDMIYSFNDDHAREREEVIEVLDRAIENLKSQP